MTGAASAESLTSRETALEGVHPFTNDICASWREAATSQDHCAPLHERALDELKALADEGRVILLNAPRAGHGKTHLLGRVAEFMADEAVVATLPWQSPESLSWETTGRGIISDLSRSGGRPNSLQRVCGGVLAVLLRRLIQIGRIPSTDPAQALQVLSKDPMQLFTDSGPARVIGDWFRRHFEQLRRPLAEVSAIEGIDDVEVWMGQIFEYATQATPAALAALQARMEGDAALQVMRFIKLVTVWRPLVLVADHMDGLYRDASAGQTAARMALELANLQGVRLVLSLNQDLWDTSFGRNLPSAFEDRLTARSVSLRGLDEADARKLVVLRLREAGVGAKDAADFLEFIDLERFFIGRPLGSISARGLLRHAAFQWRAFVKSGPAPQRADIEPGQPMLGELEANDPLPTFDATDEAEIQRMVAVLTHDAKGEQVDVSKADFLPEPATPTLNIVPSVPPPAAALPTPAPFVSPPAPPVEPMIKLVQPEQMEPESFLSQSGQPPAYKPAPPALREAPQNSFQKLRQILSRIKVSTDSVPLPDTAAAENAVRNAAANHVPVTPSPVVPNPVSHPTVSNDLLSRFDALRAQFSRDPATARMDWQTLSELIRLAGKRFTVVHYDEVELPGLAGRSLPRWSMHGTEVVFGIEDFADERYWKTVSSFVAGRIAELTAGSVNEAAPQLKLVVCKTDAEGAKLAALIKDEIIPPSVRLLIDTVHLDNRTLASLRAMRQLIREAESGQLSTNDPTAVLGALASELDFFWKRLIRPR